MGEGQIASVTSARALFAKCRQLLFARLGPIAGVLAFLLTASLAFPIIYQSISSNFGENNNIYDTISETVKYLFIISFTQYLFIFFKNDNFRDISRLKMFILYYFYYIIFDIILIFIALFFLFPLQYFLSDYNYIIFFLEFSQDNRQWVIEYFVLFIAVLVPLLVRATFLSRAGLIFPSIVARKRIPEGRLRASFRRTKGQARVLFIFLIVFPNLIALPIAACSYFALGPVLSSFGIEAIAEIFFVNPLAVSQILMVVPLAAAYQLWHERGTDAAVFD